MWLSPKIFPERLWHRNSIARLRTSTSRGALKHLCARAARGLDHHTSCSQSCITAQDTKRQDHVHKCLSIIRCFPEPFKTKRISLARRVSRKRTRSPDDCELYVDGLPVQQNLSHGAAGARLVGPTYREKDEGRPWEDKGSGAVRGRVEHAEWNQDAVRHTSTTPSLQVGGLCGRCRTAVACCAASNGI
jgi:hypothetical protein